jgi:hypothetical protein
LLYPDSNQCKFKESQPLDAHKTCPLFYNGKTGRWETSDTSYGRELVQLGTPVGFVDLEDRIPSSEPACCSLNPDWEDAAVYPDAPSPPTSFPVTEPSPYTFSTTPSVDLYTNSSNPFPFHKLNAQVAPVKQLAVPEPTDICKIEFRQQLAVPEPTDICKIEFKQQLAVPEPTDICKIEFKHQLAVLEPTDICKTEFKQCIPEFGFEYEGPNSSERIPSEDSLNHRVPSSGSSYTNEYIWDTDDDKVWNGMESAADNKFWDWFESHDATFYSEFGHYVNAAERDNYAYYKKTKESSEVTNASKNAEFHETANNDDDVEQNPCFPAEKADLNTPKEETGIFWLSDYMEEDASDIWSLNDDINQMDPEKEALLIGQENIRWV